MKAKKKRPKNKHHARVKAKKRKLINRRNNKKAR
jgi:hypothetical protein